ncbi:MAG: FAD-dependent monooxygenase, partial [Deltaproteobacteria bacterium]|nr:FAD-dependent monooxygenase [Deltaproteobacteria bacterium]
MNRGRRAFDALVVGGGTSGAAAAAFLAEAGLHTALVERRRLDDAGASWINAVPAWMFDRAGVEAPAPPERHGIFGRGSFRSPLDRASIDLEDVAAWDVDMRALGARLRRRAAAAGVHAFERTRVEDVQVAGGRVRALEVRGEESGPFRLEAALVVDASGRGGAVRRRVPELRRDCPQVGATDTCTAAASLHRIADVSGAQEFLARHRLRPGRAITWMGLAGGFSSLIVSMDEEVRSVSLVTGTIADGHHPSGPALLARALREHPWIGERISGGRGLIPLRRSFDRL